MKALKRAFSLLLALLLILSVAVPALAEESPVKVYHKNNATVIVNRNSVSGVSSGYLYLAHSSKNFNMKRSSIKVTAGTAGVSLGRLYKNANVREDTETGINQRGEYVYYVELYIEKTGTAKISYKVEGKTYNLKIKVMDYENPVKTVKLTGIKSGKNIASMTKTTLFPETIKFNTSIKNSKLSVTAAAGWVIREIEIYDITSKQYRAIGNSYSEGKMTSGTINWGTLNVKHNYEIIIRTHCPQKDLYFDITYHLNGAKAAA